MNIKSKISLRSKLFWYYVVILSIPLIFLNIIWFYFVRDQVLITTTSSLRSSAADIATHVEAYVKIKETALEYHSHTDAMDKASVSDITHEFHHFLEDADDFHSISYIGRNGNETVFVSNDSGSNFHIPANYMTDPHFLEVITGKKESSTGTIRFDTQGLPTIDIYVPVYQAGTKKTEPRLHEPLDPKTIKSGIVVAVVKANISLKDLWNYINSVKIGAHGYAFLIDTNGSVLAHRNTTLYKTQKNLRGVHEIDKLVEDAVKYPDGDEGEEPEEEINRSVNEFGIPSVSSHARVHGTTNWAIITEVPLNDVLKETYIITMIVISALLVILALVAVLSYYLARKITQPIKQLEEGSRIIGSGNLEQTITIKSGDEIETLGDSFNLMAANLKEAFKKLTAERNKLAFTVSGISDGIIVVNLKREIILFNKSAETITGYTETHVIGKPIEEIISLFEGEEKINSEIWFPSNNGNKNGVLYTKQKLKLIGLDNKESYVNVAVGQINEGYTAGIGCIITLHDITGEQQLEDMKLDFVSIAAHELRTPITSIRGYLSILLESDTQKKNSDDFAMLQRADISAQRLYSLIDNLLSVSKIEGGRITVHMKPTNWLTLVKQVVADISHQAKDKNIHVELQEPSAPLQSVKADPLLIDEVLLNLLSNAISYTAPGGTISIRFDTHDNFVVTHIQDTGEGIPNEVIEHLFTKFYRVSRPLEQGSKGTGLGLYISKSIIEMHHGTIWVESQVGKGSTFSFSLPIA